MAPCKVLVKQKFFAALPQFPAFVAGFPEGSPMTAAGIQGKRVMAAQHAVGWHDSGMALKGASDSVNGVAIHGLAPVVKDLLLSLNEG
ncbi:MAG TPA: hypothetical protein VJ527_10720 [Rhodanobacter sp.]|nr:hypothetical protein [Rhodanobacter sp.]